MSENIVAKALEKDMVVIKVELCKPFYNFIKEYLAFFGSKRTVEDFVRTAAYDDVCYIYKRMERAILNEYSGKFIEENAWFNKHKHLGCVCSPDPDRPEEQKELVKPQSQE